MYLGLGEVKTPLANPLSQRHEWVAVFPGSYFCNTCHSLLYPQAQELIRK